MSLKLKLYIGFGIMMALALLVGILAIAAFRTATDNVRNTDVQVDEMVNQTAPVSAQFSRLSTSVTEAGNSYYSFIYNYLDTDFQRGEVALEKSRKAVEGIVAILARAQPSAMPTTRKNLPVIVEQVNNLDENTDRLRNNVEELIKIRTGMSAVAPRVFESMTKGFVEARERLEKNIETEAGKEGFRDDVFRRSARLQFLSEIQNLFTNARVAFWQAQGIYGKESADAYAKAIANLDEAARRLKDYNRPENIHDPLTARTITGIQTGLDEYLAGIRRIKELSDVLDAMAVDINASYSLVNSAVTTASDATGKAMDGINKAIQSGMANIAGAIRAYTMAIAITVAAAFLLGLIVSTLLVRNITRPIQRIIATLTDSSAQINVASGQIAAASQSLAEGSITQAASLEETSSALEQMASMTRQNADNAGKTNETTRATGTMVGEGGKAIKNMSTAMADINDKAERVGHIIKTIEDIAFQTNLLALNAAVEAARAGEAGKGFAVVADEVRNLSQRSAQAAKDTTDLITGTVASVSHGSEIAGRLTESFANIENGAYKVSELVENITAASNEQAQGVDQINTAMAQMDKITQQNAADAEETASSCEELSTQAEALVGAIGELATLVSGAPSASGAAPRYRPGPASTSAAGGRRVGGGRALPGPRRPTVAKVDPNMLIPLDEGTAEDF